MSPGLPPGCFCFLPGHGAVIGDALWQNPGIDGVVFTGSKTVGMRIHHGISTRWIKPCLMELGGKNSCIVLPSADLDAAAEGAMKSAFGLQNQKCSATSRVYVHEEVAEKFIALLVAKTKEFVFAKAGDPSKVLAPVLLTPAG